MPALQIRNLPEGVHRKLKARAAQRGQSLSEYAGQILRAEAETPTRYDNRPAARHLDQDAGGFAANP